MSCPSQLFSCVNASSIQKHPLNRSTSKSHWSFSKSSRFPNTKLNCDSYYDIPSTKSKRNTSFGYGKKTDLQVGKHQHNIVPAPTTYQIPNFVQINKKHKKGFTPRYSREQIAPMSYIQLQPAKVPGPGRYQQFRYNETPHWTLHKRVNSQLFPQTTQKIVPGPGNYKQVDNVNEIGKYFLSNRKNSRSKVFNPRSSQRFSLSNTPVPGPGTYQPKNDLSNEGQYVLSNNVSDGKRIIVDGNRESFVHQPAKRTQTPGPGSYRIPSQFGHYDEVKQPLTPRKIISHKTDRTKQTKNI